MSNYILADAIPQKTAKKLTSFSPLQQQLLYNRDVTSESEAVSWLTPQYDEALHDPFLLHDMEVAVVRIEQAIQNNERIAIYSDYDCDGIPGAVVLHDFLTAVGHTNFTTYIPHRHYEGFGLNESAVDALSKDNVDLIITIDCGTTNYEAVAQARKLGIDVIITDHHEPKEVLPEAIAIVNPTVGDTYPFKGLCGAAVLYKVIQALLSRNRYNLPEGAEKWWLDMVGVATIADMVPLRDENRSLAHYGLRVLRKSRRAGLQQLLKKQRASQVHLTEDDIGFTIGPRINAASRMGEPLEAFKLLTAPTEGEARAQADMLEQLNNERKGHVAAMTRKAHTMIEQLTAIPAVLVIGDPNWRPSLVGLVANKLAEEHNVPAFVWGRDGNNTLKGSCRSNGDVSVITIMEEARDYFTEYGGHHFSGGFSVTDDAIHTLAKALQATMATLGQAATVAEPTEIDSMLSLNELSTQTIKEIQQLGPFGVGNPKPLFQFVDVIPDDVQVFGKTKEHTKLLFSSTHGAREGIAFFALPDSFTKTPTAGEACTVLAHVEESFFMGRKQTRLRIVDIT